MATKLLYGVEKILIGKKLGGSYRTPIQMGIRIANEQAAPDLMVVPLEVTSD
jgi:hypothetical protein